MLMQHLAVQTKSIVVFSEVACIRRDQINPCQSIGKTGNQKDICLASQSARRSVKQQVLISVHSMHASVLIQHHISLIALHPCRHRITTHLLHHIHQMPSHPPIPPIPTNHHPSIHRIFPPINQQVDQRISVSQS